VAPAERRGLLKEVMELLWRLKKQPLKQNGAQPKLGASVRERGKKKRGRRSALKLLSDYGYGRKRQTQERKKKENQKKKKTKKKKKKKKKKTKKRKKKKKNQKKKKTQKKQKKTQAMCRDGSSSTSRQIIGAHPWKGEGNPGRGGSSPNLRVMRGPLSDLSRTVLVEGEGLRPWKRTAPSESRKREKAEEKANGFRY